MLILRSAATCVAVALLAPFAVAQPAVAQPAVAQPAADEPNAARSPGLLRLVPPDAVFAVVIDAERLRADPLFERLAPVLTEPGGPLEQIASKWFGQSPDDVLEAAFFVPRFEFPDVAVRGPGGRPPQPVTLIRLSKPATVPENPGFLRALPDGRTLVQCDDLRSEAVDGVMQRAAGDGAALPLGAAAALADATGAGLLGEDGGRPALLAFGDLRANRDLFLTVVDRAARFEQNWLPAFGLVRPAFAHANTVALAADLTDGGLSVRLTLDAENAAGAERLERTAAAALTLGENLAEVLPAALLRENPEAGAIAVPLAATARRVIADAAVSRPANGSRVTVAMTADADALAPAADLLAALLRPQVKRALEAARLDPRRSQLKRIGLALLKYHGDNKRFPPAVTVENGVARSWRVELLPYLGEEELYEAYRKDQPWDSAANKAVLAKQPAVYRLPGDERDGFPAGYLAVRDTVEGYRGRSMWIGERAVAIRDTRDGTVHTLLAVESPPAAGRAVPWTKPEDIEADLSQPVPASTFVGPPAGAGEAAEAADEFLGLFVEGSVRALPGDLDPETLRALLTRAGGELANATDFPDGR